MPQKADYLLSGGTVITVDEERRIIRDGAVAIRGDRIAAVGKAEELNREFTAGRTIDAKGKLIMPGFVNSHMHFYHTMHRGLAPENLGGMPWSDYVHRYIATVLTPEDEIYGGLTILLETLKAGTTTFLEAGSYNPAAVIEGISRIGMRGLMGRRSFDDEFLGHSMLLEDTETCLKENLAFLEKYKDGYNGGLIKACVDVVGLGRCSDKLYIDSKKMADDYGTTLNFHLAAMFEELTATRMRYGHRPVEHMYHLDVLGPNTVSRSHGSRERAGNRHAGRKASAGDSLSLDGAQDFLRQRRVRKISGDAGQRSPPSESEATLSDCSNYADMIPRHVTWPACCPKDYRLRPPTPAPRRRPSRWPPSTERAPSEWTMKSVR